MLQEVVGPKPDQPNRLLWPCIVCVYIVYVCSVLYAYTYVIETVHAETYINMCYHFGVWVYTCTWQYTQYQSGPTDN